MKKALLGGVAAVVFAASAPVLAAPPAPVFSWTGCYVGASAGYGWAKESWNGTSSGGFLTTVKDMHDKGWLGGGQIGCDYQMPGGPWVAGLDASFSWANLHGQALDGYQVGGTWDNFSHQKNLGLFTGRLGWAAYNQSLIYVRGGWATANFDFRNAYPGNYTGSENLRGWTAGFGYELMAWRNVSLFVEYDYVKLSKNHADLNGYFTDVDWKGWVVKGGVNWHLWTP